jgi:heptaprenyl diphosphate synthase component 2
MSWLSYRAVEMQLQGLAHALAVEAAQESIPEACRYLLKKPGKSLRGALLLLSASFGSRTPDILIPLALGVELLHTATLYHDDVIDNGSIRRGLATPSALWGNHIAVYAGGYLLSRSMELFAMGGDQISLSANQYVKNLWMGQMEEIENLGNIGMRMTRYLRIISRKTGSLFELPCRIGAVAAGTSIAVAQILGRFGRKIGAAFQLADDLSDFLSDPSVLGKQSGTDLRELVCSIPVLHCTLQGTLDSQLLEQHFRSEGPGLQLTELRSILYRSGSIVFTKGIVYKYLRSAATILGSLPHTDARDSLFGLTEWLRGTVASLG